MVLRSPSHLRETAEVRALAADKGYVAERAHTQGLWRLVGAYGLAIRSPSGSSVFTTNEAKAFLTNLPSCRPSSDQRRPEH